MGATTHSIEVNAPLRAVYNQWTQFKEFPRFMEGVMTEITEQIPDVRIVWKSIEGTPNSGKVTFEPFDANQTRVTLTIDYEPESLLEITGAPLGNPSSQVKEDLERFRDFIEARGAETDGWRREIHHGMTTHQTRETEAAPECVTESKESKESNASRGDERGRPEVPIDTEKPSSAVPGVEAREQRIHEGLGTQTQEFYRQAVRVSPPSHAEIAARSYELYLRRGKAPGHAEEDWLEAERQLFEQSQHTDVH
jgi:Protein of unknown function (DUF2934)